MKKTRHITNKEIYTAITFFSQNVHMIVNKNEWIRWKKKLFLIYAYLSTKAYSLNQTNINK